MTEAKGSRQSLHYRGYFALRWLFLKTRQYPVGSILVFSIMAFTAIFADLIAPYDPLQIELPARLQPPVFAGGSWAHPLGTDEVGRDMLARIMFGTRISLLIAVVALVAGGLVGTVLGVVGGYLGGAVDSLIMRIADIVIGYPVILLALLLAVVYGPSTTNVVIAVVFILWAQFARMVRGEVLSIRERDYVALARVAGASPIYIMARHILPNVANTVLVLASLQLGSVILIEAGLSFLGAGVPPPAPAWGLMVALGRQYITTAWWVPVMPAIAIMLAVLSFNLFGDWMRDKLDPKLVQL